ncbi:MAG: transglycosylase SLT domain-containing protein [Alphaproteobacteria bacterium]|nr:transglycosylase SLT domain-containing protein [Alphaproteobacteria bacterium]
MKHVIAKMFRFACARPVIAGMLSGAACLFAQNAFAAALEQTPQVLDKHQQTCAKAIEREERARGIPKGLLHAIALAETGRWDADDRESFAWPWTVTTGGKGHFLPGPADAVAFVRSLRADHVANIDVGCMQINLHYHPDAFSSIEQAFDPKVNVAYAADFLSRRHRVSKSWIQAAGDYHSTTPERNKAYRERVARLWNATAAKTYALSHQQDDESEVALLDGKSEPAQMDSARPHRLEKETDRAPLPKMVSLGNPQLMSRLNGAFRMRAASTISARSGAEIVNRVNALKPGAHLMQPQGSSREDGFAERRQAQLQRWRLNTAN